jgi:adenosylcobinamide-GDP ribazoletransferase
MRPRLELVAADIVSCLRFCTRLPIAYPRSMAAGGLAGASWAMPLAGGIVGLFGALVYWIADQAKVPPLATAGLALAATALLTGCLHEDGLADVADGFGGTSRARKLEIMRDSRIGTYGACALIVSLLLRVAALASFAQASRASAALIVTHIAARAMLPCFMRAVPAARNNGLSAQTQGVPVASAIIAAALGVLALTVGLGAKAALLAVFLMVAVGVLARSVCLHQIGGQTGDVLGALEQSNEVVVLLIAAAG